MNVIDKNVIEKMARAISAEGGFKSVTYPEKLAQAAYNAMMQHLAETGQVIVPVEPSEEIIKEMCAAIEKAEMKVIGEDAGPGFWGEWWENEAIQAYRAMIAAAKDQA